MNINDYKDYINRKGVGMNATTTLENMLSSYKEKKSW